MLTSIVQFNMWTYFDFWRLLCIHVDIWENIHTPNARWLAYWFAHFDKRILVEVLNYWLVPSSGSFHSSSRWIWLVKGMFGRIIQSIFLCITSFICYNLKYKVPFMSNFSLERTYLLCFNILHINTILISKLVLENSITNIKWNALKTTLS